MDKLINSAFDFFAYALPGGFIILATLILNVENTTIQDYLDFAQNLQLGGVIVLLVAGYLISFALTPFGRRIYKSYYSDGNGRIFKRMHNLLGGNIVKDSGYDFDDDNQKDKKLPISEKYILVRQFTPANFKYIESWHVYSLMSHNMAIANILVILFVLIRFCMITFCGDWSWGWEGFWSWVLVIVGAKIFTLLFLFSAAKFNIWSTNEQNAVIKALHLKECAEKFHEQNSEKK